MQYGCRLADDPSGRQRHKHLLLSDIFVQVDKRHMTGTYQSYFLNRSSSLSIEYQHHSSQLSAIINSMKSFT